LGKQGGECQQRARADFLTLIVVSFAWKNDGIQHVARREQHNGEQRHNRGSFFLDVQLQCPGDRLNPGGAKRQRGAKPIVRALLLHRCGFEDEGKPMELDAILAWRGTRHSAEAKPLAAILPARTITNLRRGRSPGAVHARSQSAGGDAASVRGGVVRTRSETRPRNRTRNRTRRRVQDRLEERFQCRWCKTRRRVHSAGRPARRLRRTGRANRWRPCRCRRRMARLLRYARAGPIQD